MIRKINTITIFTHKFNKGDLMREWMEVDRESGFALKEKLGKRGRVQRVGLRRAGFTISFPL